MSGNFGRGVLGADISMVGIPPATLFDGMSDDDVRTVYSDLVHLNKMARSIFTPLITPALLKIYATQTRH